VAFVVNEFGGFEGLLTLTDILQAIAGELPDASEMTGPDIEKGSDGWRVRGATTLALLAERIGFRGQAPEDCRTLGGLALHLLDRLPAAGDELEHRGWRLRVLEVKERRVERLLLQPPRAA
jgi:CBS domain containing-hemolysin-like protein